MPDFEYLFSSDGPLAGVIDNYHPRPQQVDMADRVATALADSEVLVLEAGTGTGKTLGYLLPALTSGQRIIISTGTRALQDQLCSKDLPAVADAIGRPVDIALLKGRQNYLCRHRLRMACELPPTPAQGRKADINLVANWAPLARTGDIAELEGVPESSPVWAQVTSTIDNCLGSSCPDYSNCFVVEARRRAQAADVVVVNHHLLLADLALKEEGFGEVLPGADAIIVDEAHLLADIATQFFGLNLGSRRLLNFTRDATAECVNAGLTRDHIEPQLSRLDEAVRQAQLVAHEIAGNGGAVALSGPIVEALGAVWQATLALNERVAAIAEASAGLGRCLTGENPSLPSWGCCSTILAKAVFAGWSKASAILARDLLHMTWPTSWVGSSIPAAGPGYSPPRHWLSVMISVTSVLATVSRSRKRVS